MKEALQEIEEETNEAKKAHLLSNYRKKQQQFESIFDSEVHAALVRRGERRFTHKALLGALMIVSYWSVSQSVSLSCYTLTSLLISVRSRGFTNQTNF